MAESRIIYEFYEQRQGAAPVCSSCRLVPLLHHLSYVCPTIKLTMELEKDGFLPQQQTNTKGGRDSECDCFLKTDTHRQVPALQLPPPSKCKEGCRQESRARNVTLQREDLWKEEEHLTATFKQNG